MSYRFANPTVYPAQNFDPSEDAQSLRSAMRGILVNESAMINVLCKRSNEQREFIQRVYKANFGKDLIDDIRSDTSYNFQNVLVALLTRPAEFYANELHEALGGALGDALGGALGGFGAETDEDTLIENLCPLYNIQIKAVQQAYKRIYGKDLEKELIADKSSHFKQLLVSMVNAHRDESGNVHHGNADWDVDAGVKKLGTDESTFNMIFAQHNFHQIILITKKYHQMVGHSLEDAIKREFRGNVKNGPLEILHCCPNKVEYFANRLYKSMVGMGSKDDHLIRLVVTRSEVDLGDIKIAFQRMYGRDLESWIKSDTTGYYRDALLALINEKT